MNTQPLLKRRTPVTTQFNSIFNTGFTLIEALFVLAILGIMLSLASPALDAFSARNQAKTTMQKLAGIIRLSRNHAVNHQQTTIMCPSQNGQHCQGDWHDGILVFEDRNHNLQADAQEVILYFNAPFIKQGSLEWTALRPYLAFSEQGLPKGTIGSFIYCPANKKNEHAHALIMSFSGKFRLAEDKNGDGIKETGSQQNISC